MRLALLDFSNIDFRFCSSFCRKKNISKTGSSAFRSLIRNLKYIEGGKLKR